MRHHIRNQMIELALTIKEGGQYIKKAETSNAILVSEDCHTALESIKRNLEEGLTETSYLNYKTIIITAQNALTSAVENKKYEKSPSKDIREFCKALKTLIKELKDESEVKLEVLFIPYKYSMWDSLESIWLSAEDDPKCNSYVMPIPYYERDSQGLLKQFNYEGEHFLTNNVPIVSYKEYDIAKRRPDVIYFHNPYDGNNLITSVSPEFYSDRLKQYTDMLVYVPYFIAGAYRKAEDAASKCVTNGVLNATKVIVQSEVLKEIYIENGIKPDKVVALGSPKIDAILNLLHINQIPKEWEEIIRGKKIILLNSSLARLLNTRDYMKELKSTIEVILEGGENVLIWRPHPLMHATISSMRPELEEEFEILKNFILNSENAILDESEKAASAIQASDAMISDGSSLIRTYIVTGKPILSLESSKYVKEEVLLSSDVYSCYFSNDGISISKFIEMVNNEQDPMQKQRIKDYKNSIVNSNGDCGYKIYSYIKGLSCTIN
ncbi:CDP-glycerol glycerophosphotransferase family protein [Sporosarcina sp. ACRSM]|uniref:CDP-glycerol glycerophosphotransferase family protein n=1 Tax=Sporosarcina sp. ACRSM TaxID=2918216 RepID=UPI001EF41ADF|nr:CDP-glycerol glycerophosphotransferase family protein [Sporosarcina sp. ACRSM]MCG7334343.1 CDP-glycerol glycerophosphotransferase family protein [Sporosarcina sp. ACRSM]